MSPQRANRPRTVLLATSLIAVAAGLPACTAASRAQVERPLAQGQSWELVLPTRQVAEVRQQTPLDELPEYGRRDVALALRTPRAPTALDTWPTAEPSLLASYYLRVPNRAEDVLIVPPFESRVVPIPADPPYGWYPTYPPARRGGYWR